MIRHFLIALALAVSLTAVEPTADQLKELNQLAETGDAEAQYVLGHLADPTYNEKAANKEVAIRWYRKAADQGHVEAMVRLAWALMGSNDSTSEMMKLYRKAADLGHPVAQHQMGYFSDGAESLAWYRKAAAQGYGSSLSALGQFYLRGTNVPKDDVEALKWFKLAMEKGNLNSQWNVAYLREQGKGGEPKDLHLAIDLYIDAALKDHEPSIKRLHALCSDSTFSTRRGDMFYTLARIAEKRGRPDGVQHFLESAARAGHPEAKAELKRRGDQK
jgi:TPR repeat protein